MTQGASGREGGRSLKARVKTARNRTLSSTLWLSRQINDPYVDRAKREGYRSRAAYKLVEIDERAHILKPGQKIVDLGAAPGGWSQVAAEKIGANKSGERKTGVAPSKGKVFAIDLLDMAPMPGVEFRQMDFLDPAAPDLLREWLGGTADVVLSDMAANATGHKKTDQLRIIGLVELAAEFACEILGPGGAFLAKVLQGGTDTALLAGLKRDFAQVKHIKPPASRAGSSELYVLATGFRGRREGATAPEGESDL
jgi:23S rRNA (uridine2552-2'-O)-methyltransferase